MSTAPDDALRERLDALSTAIDVRVREFHRSGMLAMLRKALESAHKRQSRILIGGGRAAARNFSDFVERLDADARRDELPRWP